MKKYSKIGHLSTVIKNIVHERQFVGIDDAGEPMYNKLAPLGTQEFVGTVKIHGTNAAIRDNFTTTGELSFQSRENVITPTSDNAGFAIYMTSKTSQVKALFACLRSYIWERDPELVAEVGEMDIIMFGEWAGGSIQKGVAIAEIPKTFFIFDICLVSKNEDDETESKYLDMRKYQDVHWAADRIYNVWDTTKFPTYNVTIDLENPKLAQNDIVAITDAVEIECPIAKWFGHSGIGEGVVWRAADKPKAYMYKVKGDKHSKSKVKKTNLVDVEKLNSVTEFVERFCDEERLEQGYQKMAEFGHPYERATIQHFIRWLISDIVEEEADTMAESGIITKDIGGAIGKIASRWFVAKIDAL